MRDPGFCRELAATHSRLDFIVNNACQTVRRPPGFYAHMMEGERTALQAMTGEVRKLVVHGNDTPGLTHSAELSQIPLLGPALLLEPFKIDLPMIAAFLTLIGFSVNDTIVIFDRIRELKVKTPHLTSQMINDAVNQTLSRTILTSLTAWLVVIILYLFGGEGLHGFAFALVVGFLSGTYSTVYIATPILIDFVASKTEPAKAGKQLAAVR